MPEDPTTLVFVDIETTGLDWRRHGPTEVGWIVRTVDGTETEHVMHPEADLTTADRESLEVSRYWDRIAPQPTVPLDQVVRTFVAAADGATLVGANPAFDALRIEVAAHQCGLDLTWHYRVCDVASAAAPLFRPPGRRVPSLATCAKALGVDYDPDQHHGALYDARLARDVYDRVFSRTAGFRGDRAAA